MKNESNAILVKKVLEGDASAFAELYRGTVKSVFFHAQKILKNEQDVEDAVSESYIRAFENLSKLKDPALFMPWVNRIATYVSLNMVRDDRYRNAASFDDEDFCYEPVAGEMETPDLVLDKKATEELIGKMIDALPEVQRIAVIMYYYDEMSVAEIAKATGCSEGTVKSRLNYARRNLEQAVLAEEKRGVKLYTVSPLLLLAAVGRMINGTAVPYDSLLRTTEKIVRHKGTENPENENPVKSPEPRAEKTAVKRETKRGKRTGKIGTGAGEKSAEAGAAVSGKAVKAAAIGKVLAGVLAAAITVGGAVAARTYYVRNAAEDTAVLPYSRQESEEPASSDETEKGNSFVVPAEVEITLPDDTGSVAVDDHGEDKSLISDDCKLAYRQLIDRFVVTQESGGMTDRTSCCYWLYDMDRDGVPELLIRTGQAEYNYSVEVYSYLGENTVVDLGGFSGSHTVLCGNSEGTGILLHGAHMGSERVSCLEKKEDKLISTVLVSIEQTDAPYLELEYLQPYYSGDYSGLEFTGNPEDHNVEILASAMASSGGADSVYDSAKEMILNSWRSLQRVEDTSELLYNMEEVVPGIAGHTAFRYVHGGYVPCYAEYDFDGNGVKELIIGIADESGVADGSSISAIYTFNGSSMQNLFRDHPLGERMRLEFDADEGTFKVVGSGGSDSASVTVYQIGEDGYSPVVTEAYSYMFLTGTNPEFTVTVGNKTWEEVTREYYDELRKIEEYRQQTGSYGTPPDWFAENLHFVPVS